ncbi:MAG TPA: condensation domain-containing protein, partial [Herpetosiphonaceae bacterium]
MSQEVFIFPVSFAQQRLWFIEQLAPGTAAYNIARTIRLKGHLQPAALLQTLQAIADRHEALRTTFRAIDGVPMQVVAENSTVALPLIDLTSYPAELREAEAQRLAIEEARRPFDLIIGPLLRTTLLRLDADDHRLLLTVHHMIFDGWSYSIFFEELAALYTSFTGERRDLPELPIQYADYAVWQRDWLQGAVLERQLGYWQQHLAAAPPLLALPTDHPRPPVPSFVGATLPLHLPPALAAALHALSQRAHATPFMTLLAAFQLLLARYTAQPDLVVGVPIAGRARPETAPLIGCFVNMLPLRLDLRDQPSVLALVRRVREVALSA